MSKSRECVCFSHQFLILGDFLQLRKSLGYFSADEYCKFVSVVVVFGLRPVQDAGDEEFLDTLSEDIFQLDKILGGTLAVVDGVVCIKKATEITDDMKWTFTLTSASAQVTSSVSVADKALVVEASVASKVTTAKIVVTDTTTGAVVKTQEVTVENKTVNATVELDASTAAGLYLVKVLNAEDNTAAASFTFVVVG